MSISRYYGLTLLQEAQARVEEAIELYHKRMVEAGALSELKAILNAHREA